MKNVFVLSTFMIMVLFFSTISGSALVHGEGRDSLNAPKVVSVFGKVPGQDLYAHVLILIPPGADKKQTIDESLRQQGLKPFDHSDFSVNNRNLPQFHDAYDNNDFFTQYYNPANQPEGVDHSTLIASQDIWTNVPSQNFAFDEHDDINNDLTTDRCPSIVRECPGKQYPDGYSDVAWMEIKDRNTLGVTWYYSSLPEADVALNTKFTWIVDSDAPRTFDPLTVLIHELGHVVGLGHSDVEGSIMEAYYGGVQQSLHDDDICGLQTIYGTPDPEICSSSPAPNPESSVATSAEVTYKLRNGPNGGLVVTVTLTDGNNPVSNTPVVIKLYLNDSYIGTGNEASTNNEGKVSWLLEKPVLPGTYTTEIVTVAGESWDNSKTTDNTFTK